MEEYLSQLVCWHLMLKTFERHITEGLEYKKLGPWNSWQAILGQFCSKRLPDLCLHKAQPRRIALRSYSLIVCKPVDLICHVEQCDLLDALMIIDGKARAIPYGS